MPTRATKQVTVHNAIKLDSNNPVPITFGGHAFTDMDGYSYYPFFAPDDNLFRSLLEARLLSPTQSNCLNDKIFYSIGDGLQVQDQEFPTEFDKRMNGKRQTIDDILKAVFDSFYQDGNKFIEVVRTEIGNERFVHAYPHNNMDCRFEVRKDGQDPTHVLRSKKFRRDGYFTWTKEEKPVRIPLWRDDAADDKEIWLKDKKGVERTMFAVKNEVQGVDFYGLPSNFSGLHNVVLEWRATRFNLDNFENNMFLAGLLFIQGAMSKTEEKKFLQNLKKMYTGEGKGQRILPISSEAGLTDTKFVPFNSTQEGHFMDFDKHNIDKIISANTWSKDLMDLKETSGLGKGGEYLKQLFKIKFRTAISPVQQVVMNNFIFPLMQIIDEWKNTKFYDLPWYIKPVIPVSLEGMLDINSLLTVDEGREEMGKAPLKDAKKGKMLISEVAAAKKNEQKPADGGAKK
jgi:hypothetical protein